MNVFISKLFITIRFLLVLVLISSNSVLESAPLSITSDKEALISFKSQVLAHDFPNPLSTWDENLSPCNWSGVSCNEIGQRVSGLRLSGLRMTGSISPHLGNLSFLRSLELQNNQLSGDLPHQLGNLFRLRMLNLSFNSIQGVIPWKISGCRNLRVLDLMQNRISGNVPREVGLLTQLQVLNLAKNRLFGDIPSSFANLSSLADLNLGTNSLSGRIPGSLDRLTKLKFLDLTINSLSGTVPPSIYNMSSLVSLALASNDLWGDLPGNVGTTLPNLLVFNFCINRFTGTVPWSLHNLTNIKVIRMAHNLLHGSVPPGLGNLPNLEMYNIGYNRIEGGLDFLPLLANSTRLDFLAIDGNLLQGVIPGSVGNLSKVLTKFFMGQNDGIYGTIPSSIGELRALQLLNLSYTSISGEIPSDIGELKELRVLELANTMLSGNIPDSLGNLQMLTQIDLSRNKLVGIIPKTFGNLQSLLSMDLSDNSLNGSVPTEVFKLRRLSTFLNLSKNHLTGSLPLEIESLENVAVIDISDNMLAGNIPRTIVNCKSLEQLSLARNMLSGPIPDTLGSVRGLGTLDLSSNRLSGKIPFSLETLQSLHLLNLSFNNFEGRVPMSGIFADPSKVHLEGNPNLCSFCKSPRGRKLTTMYVIISVASFASVCFVIGLIWYYYRKGKRATGDDPSESLKTRPQMVSYNDLRAATDDFSEDNLVGHGSFGVVYKGLLEGVAIAVKVVQDATAARSRKTFLAECAALRHVRHRNLVKLMTVCSSIDEKNEEFLALIYEYMSNGSLDDWIRGRRKDENGVRFSVLDRLRCAIGIASALDYLHNETQVPIVHCDLKPSNVLLDSDMTPKVADFGLAKILLMVTNNLQNPITSTNALRGSIGYIPPEYGFGEKASTAGDVYSYGILVLELFTGRSPTHEMFTGGLSLKSWVHNQFPNNVDQVLDIELLEQININSCKPGSPYNVTTILGVGLSCAAESPDARLNIRDALRKLKNVEEILLQKHDEFVDGDQC